MEIIKVLFWLIVLYGTTQIICESTLFKPFRNMFNKVFITKPIYILLTCILCVSTWLGFFYSNWWYSPIGNIFGQWYFIGSDRSWFLDGMFGSCVVWFISRLERKLDA